MADIPSLDLKPRPVEKSAGAYRTIGEVSSELGVPQHVLRFWEAKFPQIKPLKRGGGRRYYRPEDVDLLRRIESLLYRQGYTIRGVQRLLGETGKGVDPAQEALPLDVSDTDVSGTDGNWSRKKADLQGVLEELLQLQRLLEQS